VGCSSVGEVGLRERLGEEEAERTREVIGTCNVVSREGLVLGPRALRALDPGPEPIIMIGFKFNFA